jgi:glycosyltransferase involved in cell wall biosynthesis
MHIAFNGWFWNQPSVGSGQYIRHLLAALQQLDPDLTLTLIVPEHVTTLDHLPPDVNVAHGKTRFGGKLGKVWFEQRGYPDMVRSVGADIAHVPYWGAPLSSPARLVTSVLDIIPLKMPVYRGGIGNLLYTSLVSASAKGSAHVLTLSEASKRDIVDELEISGDKITVTHLAVPDHYDPKIGSENDETVREKYDLPDEYVLVVGGFDVRKNVNTLLLAWTYAGPSLGEQMPLVLAGRYPRQAGTPRFPDLKTYAKELDIERFLMWIGEFDEEDRPALYRMATAVVVPSKYEGFGLPVLEAMACGTPVVASDASSLPEVAGDAAYLVDPDDARAMGAAILAVCVQDDLNQHLANAGRGQATQFSWRKTAQQTLDVYRQVMEADDATK